MHELPRRHSLQAKRDALPARRSTATASRRSRWRRATPNKGTIYGCHELEIYPDDRLDLRVRPGGDPARHEGRVRRPRHAARLHRRQAARHAAAVPRARHLDRGAGVQDRREGHRLRRRRRHRHRRPDGRQVARSAARRRCRASSTSAPPSTRAATRPSSRRPRPSTRSQDIDFDHEAELTASRRFLLATDERGGGVTPPGATCPPRRRQPDRQRRPPRLPRPARPADAPTPGTRRRGVRRPTRGPRRAARRSTARRSAPSRRRSLCTAHVFQQIPGQNRIFMGWYSQGTQVVDFTENPDGTIDFNDAGYFIPINANTWVVGDLQGPAQPGRHVHLLGRDRRLQHSARPGATRSTSTRSRCPRRLTPQGGTGSAGAPAAAPVAAGRALRDRGRLPPRRRRARQGRGLRLDFTRASARSVRVDVFRQARGRSITRLKRVKAFRPASGAASRGRRAERRNGYYVVRFRTQLADGSADLRRIAVRRRGGRFTVRPAFQRADSLHEPRRRVPAQPAGVRRAAEARAVRLLPPQRGGRREAHRHPQRQGRAHHACRKRYARGRGATIRLTPKGRATRRLPRDDQRRAPGPHARRRC